MSGAGDGTSRRDGLVTVTLNAALDQTLECPGFAAGAVNRVAAQALTAGGKGINVAALLAGRAAGPVTAAGFLGRDNAAPFEALFRERGIQDRCLRLPGGSRVNIKVVDRLGPGGPKVTDINLPGLSVPPEALSRLVDELDALAREHRWFVLAGSVPAGVPDDFYAEMVRRLKARGCSVAVDASGAPLRHAVAARPDMIKPNQHELGELLGAPLSGGRAEVLRAARELQRSGVGLVVVSLGADGALLVDAGRALLAVPPPIEVASTVGAGDAMVAGVLSARLGEGGDLEACARLGTAFAAGKLAQVGPVLPPDERIQELRAATRIERLDPA
ncbi:1-phosphofructokinase [Sorangium sp. So ce1151]|uniref:1-phosphofructokinase n=1 Tax=Sorangium sp. So ce1151 TaxID=3133332 RepID=UPI003F63D62C